MCFPSCTAYSLTLARAYKHVSRNICVAAIPPQERYFSNINQSVLTPESVLWRFLHSCQSNDALFSGTSCKTAAAIEPCHDRKPSTGPSWVPRPHAPLQDTWCSCRGFSAALHPLSTACSVSRDHSRTVRTREGLRPLLQHYQCATLLESPCPGRRGHPIVLVPGRALSSLQLGVWEGNPHLGRGFPRLLGHCSPTWRDEQVTRSAKGSDRWQQRDKFHPKQPVRGRRSSQALAVCHLLKIF